MHEPFEQQVCALFNVHSSVYTERPAACTALIHFNTRFFRSPAASYKYLLLIAWILFSRLIHFSIFRQRCNGEGRALERCGRAGDLHEEINSDIDVCAFCRSLGFKCRPMWHRRGRLVLWNLCAYQITLVGVESIEQLTSDLCNANEMEERVNFFKCTVVSKDLLVIKLKT